MLCLSQKRMVVTKDQPHSPGHGAAYWCSLVKCEEHIGYPGASLVFKSYRELSTSVVRSDRSVHCATSTAQISELQEVTTQGPRMGSLSPFFLSVRCDLLQLRLFQFLMEL